MIYPDVQTVYSYLRYVPGCSLTQFCSLESYHVARDSLKTLKKQPGLNFSHESTAIPCFWTRILTDTTLSARSLAESLPVSLDRSQISLISLRTPDTRAPRPKSRSNNFLAAPQRRGAAESTQEQQRSRSSGGSAHAAATAERVVTAAHSPATNGRWGSLRGVI